MSFNTIFETIENNFQTLLKKLDRLEKRITELEINSAKAINILCDLISSLHILKDVKPIGELPSGEVLEQEYFLVEFDEKMKQTIREIAGKIERK